MIRSRTKKALLVAPKAFPDELLPGYATVRQVSAQTAIFPSIHELKPDVILFDYEYLGPELERVLRRMQSNPFYRNIKICCYKNKEHTRVDGLLKFLGVTHFFYQEDLDRISNSKAALNAVNSVMDATMVSWVAGVA